MNCLGLDRTKRAQERPRDGISQPAGADGAGDVAALRAGRAACTEQDGRLWAGFRPSDSYAGRRDNVVSPKPLGGSEKGLQRNGRVNEHGCRLWVGGASLGVGDAG